MTLLAVSGNSVAPGTLGFLVVAAMGVVLVFVFRSMSRHLRKVNDQARREEEAAAARSGKAGEGPAGQAAAGQAPAAKSAGQAQPGGKRRP